ncbi:DUF3256 family protein [Parabacteroides sp. 52]|uniref:DUF3256 family protein n=1 Tax=unclassified Parabacteroides TaxID=2649774 RepID=UPI0013D29396|nr:MULTISPECIES: DUF3256 family protein [unclassified Parabacteroides]MDH6534847.1 hypothetical protein [Parabacteroides sp. PM5-20]NDV55564.1 DUF3256 family protein [Parabacteroides sp. 52]
MRHYIITLLLSLILWSGKAQDMATVFINIPDQYLPQLENAWRKDLVDLYNSGKEARLQNMMNGYSVLKKLTPDYLLLQTTDRSTVEMKLLPLINNTYIVCVSTTVYGPAPDSQVAFYSTAWEPLTSSDLFSPLPSSWFIKDNVEKTDEYLDIISRLDMELIHYQLHPDTHTLTATFTTPQYLSEEEREKVMPFIKEEPKIFHWEKYHFR